MIRLVILSILVAIGVTILCIFLADVFEALRLNNVANFFGGFCGLLGVLAGVWYFITNQGVRRP